MAEPKTDLKRRGLFAVLAALALVALWMLFRTPEGDKRVAMGAPASASNDPQAPYGYAPNGQPLVAPPSASSGPWLGKDKPVHPEVIANPPEEWPYSPDTFPLEEAMVPGAADTWDDVPSDPEHTFMVRVRPATYIMRVPDPITIELEVVDQKGVRQAVSRAEASIKSTDPRLATPKILSKDFTSGSDNLYRAKFELSKEDQSSFMGHVLCQVQVQLSNGKVYFVATSLEYTKEPDGRIVGKYKDEKRNGALYVSVAVHIDKPGMYQLRGELFGPAFQPIAESRATLTLDSGEQRMELHFFGKVLYDKKVDGPYRLRYLYLSSPNLEQGYEYMGPVIEDAYTTAYYKAAEFSSARYEAPAIEGEIIGPDHPSQQNKPPPLLGKHPEGSPATLPIGSGTTLPMGADSVTPEMLEKLKEKAAAQGGSSAAAGSTAAPVNGPPK
jgi:hypothetical protein